ncbi:KTSC domain-containing protein [uncultured Pseudoramibacter sp.]|uniref:KTSC domain-containing protein n=1 Tax=uncultured Pseudoramibacter sp. TaxID=1623493 RepID=UPI0025E9A7FD|nr:KTSC domain-containing protein [uncultured Pseudoramibacter sp.]
MISVTSSNIVAVGYDSQRRTLRVQFHNGTYDYDNVPESVYYALLNAPSKGKHFSRFIKGHYITHRL